MARLHANWAVACLGGAAVGVDGADVVRILLDDSAGAHQLGTCRSSTMPPTSKLVSLAALMVSLGWVPLSPRWGRAVASRKPDDAFKR